MDSQPSGPVNPPILSPSSGPHRRFLAPPDRQHQTTTNTGQAILSGHFSNTSGSTNVKTAGPQIPAIGRGLRNTMQNCALVASTNWRSTNSISDIIMHGPIPRYLRKPNCSYNTLIVLAIMASGGHSMPVSEIYKYIEQEFPYFVTSAPDGWKNSVRHSLSLGQYFRKVEKSPCSGWHGKKGFHWEIIPGKREAMKQEAEKYLQEEGRGLVENTTASAGLSPGRTRGIPMANYHQQTRPVLSPVHTLTPHYTYTPVSSNVSPRTGQPLTNTPSPTVLLSSESPLPPVKDQTISSASSCAREIPQTNVPTSSNAVSSNPVAEMANQGAPSNTVKPPEPVVCDKWMKILLNGLPSSSSQLNIDPCFLRQLGMDATLTAKEFANALLVDVTPEQNTNDLAKESTPTPNSNDTTFDLGIDQLETTDTSQTCAHCGYTPGTESIPAPPSWTEKVTSPFINADADRQMEPTLCHINTIPKPSHSYYKSFWKPNHTLYKPEKSTKRSTKQLEVDEEFMTAIKPHFAEETYRLGNVDRLAYSKLKQSNEEGQKPWKTQMQEEEEDCDYHYMGGKRRCTFDGWNDTDGRPLQLKVCIPLDKVGLEWAGGGQSSSRKRSRDSDDNEIKPEERPTKLSKTSPENDPEITSEEFFAAIFSQGVEDKERWSREEVVSSPLPISLAENDDGAAVEDFCAKESEFIKLLSSSEVEEIYDCLQSGSTDSTDWFLLN